MDEQDKRLDILESVFRDVAKLLSMMSILITNQNKEITSLIRRLDELEGRKLMEGLGDE